MTDAQRSQISGASERFLGKYILRITLLLRALRAITFSRKFLYLRRLFRLEGFEVLPVKNLNLSHSPTFCLRGKMHFDGQFNPQNFTSLYFTFDYHFGPSPIISV